MSCPAVRQPFRRRHMRRLLLIFWAASVALFVGSLTISVVAELRAFHWRWGAKSYMDSDEHTRELSLSDGELAFRRVDDWPTPAPAPSWRESESFDYNVSLGVFRV